MTKGTIIKDYKILEKIGQGGMATVYKAVHTSLNKEVAIKCLNSEFYGNENIRKRFVAEARTLFTLSHPNLTKVTDLIKTDDVLAIVMEYIDGKSLKEYISNKGALDTVEIKKIFSKILDGVAYIHRKGFIHRDIKPSNFMLNNDGDVKILDFGIAKNLDINSAEYTMTGTSQMMGTPMYMSPEQIKSTKDITIQTDIYSLGVVLWNMATGTKPYDQNTLSIPEIQVSILKEDLGLTNTVFDKIIQEATKKDTDVRLKKCEEFNINNISLEKDAVDEDKTVIDVVDDDKTVIDVVDDKLEDDTTTIVSDIPKNNKDTISKDQKPEIVQNRDNGFECFMKVLRDSFNIKGRSSRREFWWFTFFYFIFLVIVLIIDVIAVEEDIVQEVDGYADMGYIFLIYYSLMLFFTFFPATVRRLHDTNRSGWWAVICCIAPTYAVVTMLNEGRAIIADVELEMIIILFSYLSMLIVFIFTLLKGDQGDNKYGAPSEDIRN